MNPYRANDDDVLLRALEERVNGLLGAGDPDAEPRPGATPEDIAQAEAELGFHLPPLLRRVYAVANGGIGPGLGLLSVGDGDDTLGALYRSFVDEVITPQAGERQFDRFPWPEKLLPICDWGCGSWSCLDCRSDDGPMVTAAERLPLASAGHTLRSWLSAWLAGVDLFEETFEPGPDRAGVNPFTKKPIVIRGAGKPKGRRWP